MDVLAIAVVFVAVLLRFAALFGGVGGLPVVVIALVAIVALVFLWHGMDVRHPPDTRA